MLLAILGAPIALGVFGYQIYFSTGALWGRQTRGPLRYVWALALATTIIPALLPICVLLRLCWFR